jgi:hypothetical protein
MSLLFFDGCGEIYSTSEIGQFWSWHDNAAVNSTGGRRGGAAIELQGNDEVQIGIPESTSLVIGFAAKFTNLPSGNDRLVAFIGGSTHADLVVTAGGGLGIRSAGGGATIASGGGGSLSADTWHYIELKITFNGSTGTAQAWVDGTEIFNETSLDTQGTTLPWPDAVQWGGLAIGTTTIDDVYILDTTGSAPWNDRLGDSRIDGVMPDGDGANTEFDTTFPASPTTHYTKVDETPPNGDTDYNETNTANDIDLFDYAAMPTVIGGATVWAVKASAFCKKMDAGPADMKFVARPTTVNRIHATIHRPQTDYRYHHQIWESDPDDSVQWTEAEVDAAEFGVQAQ